MIRRVVSFMEFLGPKRARLLAAFLWMMFFSETVILPIPAHADVGGEQYSPGQCPYPAVGGFGLDGVAMHYGCEFPLEINNSRHYCVYGGVAATVGANVSLLIFQASISLPIGVLEGICYWACPDLSVAEEPDPIQTWQGSSQAYTPVAPHRKPCKSIAPNPVPPEPNAAPPPGPEVPPPGVLPQQQPVGAEAGAGPI